jgi:hypothetical protein
MENVIAIGAGLALRAVIDNLTDNDHRLTSASCYNEENMNYLIIIIQRHTHRALGRHRSFAFSPEKSPKFQ